MPKESSLTNSARAMRHSHPSERSANRLALQLRHSTPTLSCDHTLPLAAKVVPESILMQTNVKVTGLTMRGGHRVYQIQVNTGFSTHVLHKRFSEIRDFRNGLLATIDDKKHCGHGPCGQLSQLAHVKFPRRRLRLPGLKRDTSIAQECLSLYEQFLQAMLRVYRLTTRREMRVCTNSRCFVLGKIKRFLDVAEPVVYEDRLHVDDSELAVNCKIVGGAALPPVLAFSTLCGDKPTPLFSIAEDREHAMG